MATNVKCSISSLDHNLSVEAVFNPRELTIDKQVPWNEQQSSKGDAPQLEFTDAAAATLAVELLFDTYETGGDVYQTYIAKLEEMTQVLTDIQKPPNCMFKWGNFPPFKGVIIQLTVKYTMFFSDGTPCRAAATINMKEYLEPGNDPTIDKTSNPGTEQGSTVSESDARRPDRYGADHRAALEKNGSEDGRLTPGAPVPGRQTLV